MAQMIEGVPTQQELERRERWRRERERKAAKRWVGEAVLPVLPWLLMAGLLLIYQLRQQTPGAAPVADMITAEVVQTTPVAVPPPKTESRSAPKLEKEHPRAASPARRTPAPTPRRLVPGASWSPPPTAAGSSSIPGLDCSRYKTEVERLHCASGMPLGR